MSGETTGVEEAIGRMEKTVDLGMQVIQSQLAELRREVAGPRHVPARRYCTIGEYVRSRWPEGERRGRRDQVGRRLQTSPGGRQAEHARIRWRYQGEPGSTRLISIADADRVFGFGGGEE